MTKKKTDSKRVSEKKTLEPSMELNLKVYNKMRRFFLNNILAAPIHTTVLMNALNEFTYGPMLNDDVWERVCLGICKDTKYVASASEMEFELGRHIKVEELWPSVLSLSYLFFGLPQFTGSKAELYTLFHFYEVMVEGIGNYAREAADDVIGNSLYRIIPDLFKEFPR